MHQRSTSIERVGWIYLDKKGPAQKKKKKSTFGGINTGRKSLKTQLHQYSEKWDTATKPAGGHIAFLLLFLMLFIEHTGFQLWFWVSIRAHIARIIRWRCWNKTQLEACLLLEHNLCSDDENIDCLNWIEHFHMGKSFIVVIWCKLVTNGLANQSW